MSDLKSNSLAVKAPHLRSEWSQKNLVAFEDVAYASNKKYEWVCSKGHEWSASPNSRTLTKNPNRCRRCKRASLSTLLDKAPHLEGEWSSKNTDKFCEVPSGCNTEYEWICSKGHTWMAPPNNRSRSKEPSGCPECSGKRVSVVNSLRTRAPELEKEWHSDNKKKFHEVSFGEGKKYKWICCRGHVWLASPCARTGKSKTGCRKCPRIASPTNSLHAKAPHLRGEWSQKNNVRFEEVPASSSIKYEWICMMCQHEWFARPATRTRPKRPSGCPECCGNHSSKAEMDLYGSIKEKHQDAVNNQRGLLHSKLMELDIYVPSLKKAIEFDGTYWHSRPGCKERDQRKNEQCSQAGIELLRIPEVEYEADRVGTVNRILSWLVV